MGKMEAAEQTGSVQPSPNSQAQTVTLRQLSTELQNGWIERLFSRLAALYGAAFGRQWEGTNLADVKALWADKLGGFTAAQIGSALTACDERPYPPNAAEFLMLCRDIAKRERDSRLAALPIPEITPEAIAARHRQLESIAAKPPAYDYKLWAKTLRSEYLAGVHLLPVQVAMASEALNEDWEKRECHPRMEPA